MVHVSRALMTGWFGESFGLDERLPTLAEYYDGRLRLSVEPGTTFTYTDHGFATLGQIVEDVSGQPLDRYLREHIFVALGMADTDLLRSDRVTSRLATGYTLGSNGPRAGPTRGCRAWGWASSASTSVAIPPSSIRASFRGSTDRSSWLPTMASG
jgi:CubicO group peptidase (beta-lactamase class C family)